MALWSNTDANTSAPKNAVAGGLGVAGNGDTLFGNTTADVFVTGATLGVFGVDAREQQVETVKKGGHAGWVLRKTGSGGRAGRVHVETLVAMGSMTGDGSDDTPYADTLITITVQPQSSTQATGNNLTLSVTASASPAATLGYQWYRGSNLISGATNATLALTNLTSSNSYYVEVSSTGAATVTSSNAVITVV